ncbi:MAG: hypothetical protein Q8R45_00680 [Brevundimonas sp.]|uniref:hypothetical protein n=1 Tax=Brevundimonas sp. TaxID=1871086 RepID=UPI002723526D|nr:hypothetical protein [Brevundimonas sp.]MDO9587454.1 hypothetical protein [Brevundimonas sp.]MDP3655468.1 hypothetical protein [Brevundimonas sp.]MDZ4110868.1 hypothetical protein [Brevundimonas sp.]
MSADSGSQLDARGDVAARWGIGVMIVACLGAGVAEGWLAGEEPASAKAFWGRSTDRSGLNI